MCTIVFAYRCHSDYPLLLASNRDEFHDRPTSEADWWRDRPDVVGGRDLEGGGSWLALDRHGRLAAVTNHRAPENAPAGGRSRGLLVADYLGGARDPERFARAVRADGDAYAGFNLLLADRNGIWYVSNRDPEVQGLAPGVYGLSNHRLNTPWPKVETGKAGLEALLARPRITPAALLEILNDRTVPPDDRLPDTGIGLERERLLGSAFIVSPTYGTRAASAVVVRADGTAMLTERTFDAAGTMTAEREFEVSVRAAG